MGILFQIGALISGLNAQQLQDAYGEMDNAAKMALFSNIGIVVTLFLLVVVLVCLIFFKIENEGKLNDIRSEIKSLRESKQENE